MFVIPSLRARRPTLELIRWLTNPWDNVPNCPPIDSSPTRPEAAPSALTPGKRALAD